METGATVVGVASVRRWTEGRYDGQVDGREALQGYDRGHLQGYGAEAESPELLLDGGLVVDSSTKQ